MSNYEKLTLRSQRLNRRLHRLRRLIFLGVDSSWTTYGINHGAEVDLICVICGSNWVDGA